MKNLVVLLIISICTAFQIIYPEPQSYSSNQVIFSDAYFGRDKIICFQSPNDFNANSINIELRTNAAPIIIYFENSLQHIVVDNSSVLNLYLENNYSQVCFFTYNEELYLDGTIEFNNFITSNSPFANNLYVSSMYIMSDTYNKVSGPDSLMVRDATPVYNRNQYWTASLPGATWIWDASYVTNPSIQQTCVFTNKFYITGIPISAVINLAVDNDFVLIINDQRIMEDYSGNSFAASTQKQINIQQYLITGLNDIIVQVTNWGVPGDNYQQNPAGLMYKISIQNLFAI